MNDTAPFDIFRVGTHTAMSGVTLAFSEADLDAMAAAYDPAVHEAPLVVGHPKDNAPAYGWVRALARDGDRLQARPTQLDADFAELVRAGRFKKVSASFYAPDAPANPVPGAYYLRHVGFLGAQPPAVKGLREVPFADSEHGVVTLEFGEWSGRESAGLWRRLREFFISQFGLEQADQVIPSWSVETLEDEARAPAPAPETPQPAYSEADMPDPTPTPTPDPAALAEIAARQAELDAREARLAQQEVAARRRTLTEFAERLITEGRVLPKDKAGLVAFMAALPADATLEFGEGPTPSRVRPAPGWRASSPNSRCRSTTASAPRPPVSRRPCASTPRPRFRSTPSAWRCTPAPWPIRRPTPARPIPMRS
ncbi:MAG: peptidase [Chromatiales bacterium]|nr:peptidase [Chromatiales bacterium]